MIIAWNDVYFGDNTIKLTVYCFDNTVQLKGYYCDNTLKLSVSCGDNNIYLTVYFCDNTSKPSPGYGGVSLSLAKTDLNASWVA